MPPLPLGILELRDNSVFLNAKNQHRHVSENGEISNDVKYRERLRVYPLFVSKLWNAPFDVKVKLVFSPSIQMYIVEKNLGAESRLQTGPSKYKICALIHLYLLWIITFHMRASCIAMYDKFSRYINWEQKKQKGIIKEELKKNYARTRRSFTRNNIGILFKLMCSNIRETWSKVVNNDIYIANWK